MIVVKLGGSVITYKNGQRRVRGAVLAQLASELAAARDSLALVHGGGSFGHREAAKWGLRGGGPGPTAPKRRLAAGARSVNDAMGLLNHRVLVTLQRAGLSPTGLPGAAVAKLRDGKLSSFDVAPFLSAFANGLVPVTYGDAAPDSVRGHAIVSGDQLAHALAKRLEAKRVVFVTDRDGLYTAPPGEAGARLARRVSGAALARLAARGGDGTHDVTGGMAGKLKEIRRIAALGIPVTIVNGLVPGRLRDALRGRPGVATTVVPGE